MAAFKIFRKFADLLDRSTVDLPAINTPLADALAAKATSADLSTVATSGSYADLSGTPTVPTTVAELSDVTIYDFATLNTPLADALAGKATSAQGALADTAVQEGDSPSFVDVDATGTVTAADVTATGAVTGNVVTPSAYLSFSNKYATLPATGYVMGVVGGNYWLLRAGSSTNQFTFSPSGLSLDNPSLGIFFGGGGATNPKLYQVSAGVLGLGGSIYGAPDHTLSLANLTASGTVTAAGVTTTGEIIPGTVISLTNNLTTDWPSGGYLFGLRYGAPTIQNGSTIVGLGNTGKFNIAGTGAGHLSGYQIQGTVGIFRESTDVAMIGTGSTSAYRDLKLRNLTASGTVTTGAYTVATLPTPTTGMRCYVTDSNVTASGNFGATVAAGGANTVPVFYDGTNWIIA